MVERPSAAFPYAIGASIAYLDVLGIALNDFLFWP
jgi:hypothetical protein